MNMMRIFEKIKMKTMIKNFPKNNVKIVQIKYALMAKLKEAIVISIKMIFPKATLANLMTLTS